MCSCKFIWILHHPAHQTWATLARWTVRCVLLEASAHQVLRYWPSSIYEFSSNTDGLRLTYIACRPQLHTGALSPQVCPTGFYCSGASAQPIRCSVGTFCPAGSGSNVTCPAGSYCADITATPITCPAGYYCFAGTCAKSASHSIAELCSHGSHVI